jgi:hypothetical protein
MKAPHALTMMACVVAVGCGEGSPTAPSPASLGDFGDQHRGKPAPKGSITIVQGSIVLDFGFPGEPRPPFLERSAFLRGTRGFTLEATPLSTGRDPADLCIWSVECPPGTPISLDAVWAGTDLPGTATLQGQTFTLGGGGDGAAAYIGLSGTALAPPQAEEATVTAPFELQEGHFSWPAPRGGGEQFHGRGTATVFLRWREPWDSWYVTAVRYDFRGQSGR